MDETCYQTEAEEYGWSFVFGGLLPDDFFRRAPVGTAWRLVWETLRTARPAISASAVPTMPEPVRY